MQAMLNLLDVSAGYRKSKSEHTCVVSGISEEIFAGELVCLVGPNGAGKSTLLRTISGMQAPLKGSVALFGANLYRMKKSELARQISVVLTSKINVGQLTGRELAAFGRMPFTNWAGVLSEEDYDIVSSALRDAGALPFADRLVAELSDGERQKVMLARALAQEPHLMVLDEMTAFLDLPRRIEIMTILRDLAHRKGKAILLSTHDLELALSMADRLWILPKGGVLTTGVPEDLVLEGTFASAFAADGLHFDPLRGGFHTVRQPHREIAFTGSGLGAVWTRRAFERKGFALVEPNPGSEPMLSLSEVNGGYRWLVRTQDGLEVHHSVVSLLRSTHF